MKEIETITNGLVHFKNLGGHRQPYSDLLTEMFDLKLSVGKVGLRKWWEMVWVPRLMFGTIDDDYIGFIAVSVARALVGKSTSGLFLRPAQCFQKSKLKYRVKRLVFRYLHRFPYISIFVIVPFKFNPKFAEVASDWVHDPHMWDILGRNVSATATTTELSKFISTCAKGRKTVVFLGRVSRTKGFPLLAEIWSVTPKIRKKLLLVIAGKVENDCRGLAKQIGSEEALVIDRYMSDEELESLYGIADLVWCCYDPTYDQASGVFGRCVQNGSRAIIRKGSIIEQYIDVADIRAFPIMYDCPSEASNQMLAAAEELGDFSIPKAEIIEWREDFIKKIEAAL